MDVVQVSPVTGRQLRVLFQEDTGNGAFYRSFGADPSGRFLILNAGRKQDVQPMDRPPPAGQPHPANGSNVFSETW